MENREDGNVKVTRIIKIAMNIMDRVKREIKFLPEELDREPRFNMPEGSEVSQ